MTYRTRTLRMTTIETAAEGMGRDAAPGELTVHDRWMLAALLAPGLEGPEPPAEPPDADPELMALLAGALEGGPQEQAVPERTVRRVKAGILLRER